MKKTIITFFSLIICTGLFSQGIDFEKGSFAETLAKAKKEKKMVFMDCFTTWCGPCKALSNKIFPQKEVGDYFNANFVNIKVDIEKGEGVELFEKYEIKAVPTLLFMDSNGKLLHKMVGYAEAAELISEAKKAGDPSRRIEAFEKKYEEGDREPVFMANYIKMLKKQYQIEKMKRIGNDYLDKLSNLNDLLVKENFEILTTVGTNYNGEKYQYVKNNKEQFVKLTDEKTIDSFLNNIENLQQLVDAEKTSKNDLDKAIADFKKENPKYNNIISINIMLYSDYYLAQKQYDKWFEFYEKLISDSTKDEKIQNTIALMAVYKVVTHPDFAEVDGAYHRAIKMTKKIKKNDKNNMVDMNYCLAYLYQKTGNKKEALKSINNYIKLYKEKGKKPEPKIGKLKEEIEAM